MTLMVTLSVLLWLGAAISALVGAWGVWRLVRLIERYLPTYNEATKTVVHARDEIQARIRERV
ncbi:MAG: hypothetical protein QM758_06755 [Armatimonas sp.]